MKSVTENLGILADLHSELSWDSAFDCVNQVTETDRVHVNELKEAIAIPLGDAFLLQKLYAMEVLRRLDVKVLDCLGEVKALAIKGSREEVNLAIDWLISGLVDEEVLRNTLADLIASRKCTRMLRFWIFFGLLGRFKSLRKVRHFYRHMATAHTVAS